MDEESAPMESAMEDIAREMTRDDVIIDLLSKDRQNIPFFASVKFCIVFLKETITNPSCDVVTTIFNYPLEVESTTKLTHELQVRMRYKTIIAVPFMFKSAPDTSHANMIIITRVGKTVVIEHFEPFGSNSDYLKIDDRMYTQCEETFRNIYTGFTVVYFKPADFQSTWFGDLNIQSEVLKEQRDKKLPQVWTLTCVPISLWYGFKRLTTGPIYSSIESAYGQTAKKYNRPLNSITTGLILELKGAPSQNVIALIKAQLSSMNLKRDINYFEKDGVASFIYVYHSWGMNLINKPLGQQQYKKQTPRQKIIELAFKKMQILKVADPNIPDALRQQVSSAMEKYFGVELGYNPNMQWQILSKGDLVVAFFSYIETPDKIKIYNVCSPVVAALRIRRHSYIKTMLSQFETAKPQYLYVDKNNYYFINACRLYYSLNFRPYRIDDRPKQERVYMIRLPEPDVFLNKFDITPHLAIRYAYSINKVQAPIVQTMEEVLTGLDCVILLANGSYYQLNPIWKNKLSDLKQYDAAALDKSLAELYVENREAFDRFIISPLPVYPTIYLYPIIIPVPLGYFYT